MPYKDPERKRQWEREHRQQRNASRRMQTQAARSGHVPQADSTAAIVARFKKQVPDPAPKEQPTSGWKVLLGFAVAMGVVVLGAMAGLNVPPPGQSGPLPGSGDSGL